MGPAVPPRGALCGAALDAGFAALLTAQARAGGADDALRRHLADAHAAHRRRPLLTRVRRRREGGRELERSRGPRLPRRAARRRAVARGGATHGRRVQCDAAGVSLVRVCVMCDENCNSGRSRCAVNMIGVICIVCRQMSYSLYAADRSKYRIMSNSKSVPYGTPLPCSSSCWCAPSVT